MKTCSVDGCGKKHTAKGFCQNHYNQFRRHGDPLVKTTLKGESVESRLLSQIRVNDKTGCWEWTGQINSNGYGRLYFEGKHGLAHRVSYLSFKREIPESDDHHGTCVCHTCDNRICINPDHLFLADQKENMRDMVSKGRHPRQKGVK